MIYFDKGRMELRPDGNGGWVAVPGKVGLELLTGKVDLGDGRPGRRTTGDSIDQHRALSQHARGTRVCVRTFEADPHAFVLVDRNGGVLVVQQRHGHGSKT